MTASLQGKKVITAKEMARIETLAAPSEQKKEEFMNQAGLNIAKAIMQYVPMHGLKKNISILIGKGNKGGDSFTAARHLLADGYMVKAFSLYDLGDVSPLCRLQGKRFLAAGGDIHFPENVQDISFQGSSLILDGLFGTGFSGALEGKELQLVEKANSSSLPILAIDIPSGVNGSTGEVTSSAIKAATTFYLGLPKIGFFLNKGYNHIGKLHPIDFGLHDKDIEKATALAYLVNEEAIPKALPPVVRTRHKYQRGYVVGIAGSKGMGGAAKLCSLAALRAGAGMVRLFYAEDAEGEIENSPMEIIKEKWRAQDFSNILKAEEKASSLMIGPGMGRDETAENFFRALLPKLQKPLVIDADGLFHLAKHIDLAHPLQTILTPHRQEMLRLLKEPSFSHEWELIEACKDFAFKHKITLVLKGAPTFVFYPKEAPFIIPRGDPGMATAGSGDVLTGILAAMLAQGLDTYHAALLGCYLHDIAGELAAKDLTSYTVIASDLIDYLPKAYKALSSV